MPATGWGQLPVLDPPPPPTGWVPPPVPAPDPPVEEEVPGWGDIPDAGPEEPPRVLPGTPGVAGPVGPPGPIGGRLLKRAAGPLSGLRVVRMTGAAGDHIAAASALDAQHATAIVGVSVTSAGASDEEVEVVRFGELEDSGWSWVPFRNVFVGDNGVLTQTFDPSWSYICVMGQALSATKLLVDVRAPIFRTP